MCGKLCSHPRRFARHLANLVIVSLHEEEMSAWKVTGNVVKHESGIAVSTHTGEMFCDGEIWMPLFQRWKLRRAARQRAIMIAHNNFFKP